MEPDSTFIERVSELSGEPVRRCYYCLRCSAGCPAAPFMEYTPAQILRMVQLGQQGALLRSSAIWLCIGCETCGTRCPNEIHAGAVIDALRHLALEQDVAPGERKVFKLHQAFLDSIRTWGRLHELTMLGVQADQPRPRQRPGYGPGHVLKGKIHPLPKRIKGMDEIKELFALEGQGGGRAIDIAPRLWAGFRFGK
jgi:heterodisulfide reductase subunit C2